MNTETLTLLRGEIVAAEASLKRCLSAYRGLKAFKENEQGLAFCAYQLLQNAAALRDHAEQLAGIAEDLHDTYSNTPEQLDLHDVGIDGRP